jgi:hypothetical protein
MIEDVPLQVHVYRSHILGKCRPEILVRKDMDVKQHKTWRLSNITL